MRNLIPKFCILLPNEQIQTNNQKIIKQRLNVKDELNLVSHFIFLTTVDYENVMVENI